MAKQAPGKAHRKGISLMELADMFPTEEAAVKWFEAWHWPDGEMACMRCGSVNAYRVKSGKPMPYRCRDCRRYFSLKTNTSMEASNLPLRKWAYAIYLEITSLKGVSSMKLHRDLNITQSSAWFMKHRIREGLASETRRMFSGPVEVDEAYFGGKRKNMSNAKRATLTGRGPKGKQAVVAAKDRETKQGRRAGDRPDGRRDAAGLRGRSRQRRREAVHGRRHGVPGHGPGARDGQALGSRIRPVSGWREDPHERRRELLEHAEARLPRRLSPP